MDAAQVVFVVTPESMRDGVPILDSPHVRQVAPIAALLDAPIVCEPDPDALNVVTDGLGCWPGFEGRSAFIGHGVADKGNWLGLDTDYALAPNAYIAARSSVTTHIVGAPMLDALFDGTIHPAPAGDRPRVLYAPTLSRLTSGEPTPSSREHAEQILDQLAGFDVTLSDHPHHTGSGVTPLQAYADADVIVSDYGSTLSIAVALGRPVVLAPDSGTPAPGGLEEYIGRNVYPATSENLSERVALAAELGMLASQHWISDDVLARIIRGRGAARAANIIAALA